MADNVKISALPTATTVSGVDIVPIVQGGVTKQIAESNFNSAASILAKLKTVDGSGSGLDADFCDGIHGNAMWYSSSGTGGSDGNGGQPPAPKALTASATVATSTWVTLFTLPAKRGSYIVQASLVDTAPYQYSAIALVTVSAAGAAARLVSYSGDAGIEIQLSGLSVQIRQNSGGANAVVASLANVGGV